MTDQLCDLGAAELQRRYAARELSPVEVTTAILARIERLNGVYNAFVYVDRGGALRAARASEARWAKGAPLGLADGIPSTVKELLPAVGWPLRRCSRATPEGEVSTEDAPTVARLREGGAVLLGKTNSPEFGWKGTTDNLLFGATGNPWDPTRTAGGSSGGAAAAAALGMGVFHIGTDGGGSIRIPAALSGVFGMKASFGRVPVWPLSRFGTTSHAGPMSRTAQDGARMLAVLAQPDSRDWYGRPADGHDYVGELEAGVAGLKIAYSPTLGFAKVDPDIADRVRAAADLFRDLGAHVEQVDHVMDDPTGIFRMAWATGIALSLRAFPAEARALMDPGMVALGEWGERLDHMACAQAEYERGLLGQAMNAFHTRYDLLLTPAEPMAAFPLDQQVAAMGQRDWIDWTPFTYPFNLTGQPAASVPCGLTAAGLPVGLQVVGGLYEDALVLRACRAFERASPFPAPPARLA